MATPTFAVTEVAQFSHPTDEMPEFIRDMFGMGAFTAYRYTTDDGRECWVPVSTQLLKDGAGDVEAEVEKAAMEALAELDA